MKKSLPLSISILTLCLIAGMVSSVSMQRSRAAVSPQEKVAPEPGGLLRQAPASTEGAPEAKGEINAPPAAANPGSPKGLPKPTALQTVVLSDDFEGATTFVTANVAATNQWFVGTAAANGGTKGAYVSNDAGVTNAYTLTTTSTNHIYAPITVAAGQSAIVLSFDWKGVDEYDASTDFDYLRVSVSTTLPVAGSFTALADQLPIVFAGQDNYTRAYVNLPASIADGAARFLIFTWRNDSSLGFQTPAAIDNVLVTSQTPAPLSGTKTIPGDYPSIGAAIADANANGADTSGGSLTFNVAAGSNFTETPVTLTASGSSASNRIIFQKSGAGANPKITAEGSGNYGPPASSNVTSSSDAVIALNGADFVTFDGIDVATSSVQAISPFCAIEYGYLLRNNNILANVTTINSAQNNIIQNTSITLDRRKTSPASTVGILQTASTATGAGSTPTTAAQANSGNKYYNYTITNAIAGIYLLGNVTFPDLSCEAGVTGAVTQSTIGAATANDIGNGAVQTWGIRAQNQSGVKIFKNEIRNITGTSSTAASTVDGIFLDNTGSTATSVGTNEISGNTIHDLNNTNTAASVVAGIRENLTNNAGSVSNIFNNFIYNLNSSSTVTATRRIIGFRVQDSGSGAAATHNIAYNSVRMSPTNVATSNTTFEIGTSTPIFKVQNNVFANFTGAQAGAAKHYCWVSTSSSAIGGAGTVSDFNVLHVNNTTNGFTGLGSATDFATLANWQTILAGAGPDDNSWPQNPQFISPTDLHINTALATPVESHATPLLALTTVDIDGNARSATTPDIGADEGTFTPLLANDIEATTVNNPANGSAVLNGSSIATPQATFTNVGTANQTSVMVRLTITGPGGYSYVDNQTIATLNSGISFTQTFAAAPAFTTAGAYTATATNLFADSNAANDSVSSFFTVFDAINGGSVNVGTGQPYTSLTNPAGVFAAINAGTVTSNIVVTITSDLTAETGAVSLNQFAAPFTATFQPQGPRMVSGSNTTTLINLNGADNVTFNGINAGGHSLLIRNTSTGLGSVIRYIADASNDNLLNTTIESNTGSTSVFVSTGTATGNDNIVISGNVIRDRTDAVGAPFNGIGSSGTSAAISNSNLAIVNNSVINFLQAGIITFTGTDNVSITGNDVSQTASRTGTLSGINIQASTGTNLISTNKVHGLRTSQTASSVSASGIFFLDARSTTVSLNQVYDFAGVAGGTGRITGIESDGSSGNPASLTIVNNMISLAPAVDQQVMGIFDFGFSGNTFTADFNSVYLAGSTTASFDWAVLRGGGTPTTFTGRDNLLFNNRTGGTGSHFAIGDQSGATGTWVSDRNFFAGTGATPANFFDYNTVASPFATWQAGPPVRDANSVAGLASSFMVTDYFVNAAGGDLHLKPTATVVLGAGDATGTGVISDYDNDPRPATMPDIGADELVQAVAGTFAAGTYYNASAVGGDSLGGNVSITNVIYLNGKLSTGANTLAIGCNASISGAGAGNYVIGNLKKTYCAAGNFSFALGTANGFSPVAVNVTAGTFPADFTAKAVQGPQPNIAVPAKALQRYWTLTASGVTADLTFSYLDPPDVPGTATEGNFAIFKYNGSFSMPGGTVDTMANTATITGVTSFSDWTLAEPGADCGFMLSSTSQNFGAAGGMNSVGVTAGASCNWTAVSNAAFITVDSGTPGTGNGTVGYSVSANTGPARMGTITIAGITFTVTQDSGCAFMLTPTSQNFVAGGGMNSVNVTTGTGCAWTAVSNDAFITINSGTPGSGNGTVGYTVAANTGPARMGTITIAGLTFTVTQNSGCSFMLSSTSQNFVAAGGMDSVNVTAGAGCMWTAVSNDGFITINSGTPGSGNGTINYTVAANTGPARMGTMTIAGITFTVTQNSGCTFMLSPTSQNFVAAGGMNSVNVTSGTGCAWTAVSNDGFITVNSGTPGSGNGTVNYTVAANTGPARMGTMTIAGITFTVTQDSGCTFMLTPTSQNFTAPGGSNSVSVTQTTSCSWTAVSNDAFIIIDSGTPGSGNGTVGYHVTANTGPMRTGTMTIAGITFTVTQDAACAFNLSSLSQHFVSTGGMDSVNVITGTGCTWTAVSNDAFITITMGSSGSGNGTVNYTVAANMGPARMGTMTIAGITFTVSQDSGCMFTLSRNHESFPGNGGPGSVNVIASDAACPWTASTSATYIHITSGTPGTGNGALQYTVDANPGPTIRSDTITIAGQTYTVYQGINFLDVPSNDLFYNEIGKLAARGVTVGCGGGNYCPNDSVLREQMAAFILRAKGEFDPPTPASQRFTDVPPANVFYNFIDRLAVLGITVGCNPPSNTMYCPGSAVTREQMSAFLLRGLGEFNPPTPASQRFNDVPPTNVFYDFIDRMAVLNITLGCTPDHLFYCPSDPVTRAQMAAFLVRAFDL